MTSCLPCFKKNRVEDESRNKGNERRTGNLTQQPQQHTTFYYPTQPSNHPTQPSNYPSQRSTYPTQPSIYPTQPSNYPTQPSNYPTQPSNYPTQPTNYLIQPAIYQPQPTTIQPPPTTIQPQPTIYQPPPTTIQPQPTTIQPQPTNIQPQPTTIQSPPKNIQPPPPPKTIQPPSPPKTIQPPPTTIQEKKPEPNNTVVTPNKTPPGKLFEDSEFAAHNSILSKAYQQATDVKWLRPLEIRPNAEFICNDFSRFDLNQGTLADCWVVAVLSCMSERPTLLKRIIPPNQTLDPARGYCGKFRFKFYTFGQWTEVAIDDKLPTKYNQLIYTRSSEENEFWGALLEKAFAKQVGSYAALCGGNAVDAFESFSGGLVERYQCEDKTEMPKNLQTMLFRGFERNSCFCASFHKQPPNTKRLEANRGVLDNGLVIAHVYTITSIKKVLLKSGKTITLIRLRNPWGDETEWKGAWSDSSKEWNQIDNETKNSLGLVKANDGEFWMTWTDFINIFDAVDMCHLMPEDITSNYKQWNSIQFFGEWKTGKSAGGQAYYRDTHYTNPQYIVRLQDSDKDDDDVATCIVNLEEPNLRSASEDFKNKYKTKAVYVYQLDEKEYSDKLAPSKLADTIALPKEFFMKNRSHAISSFLSGSRMTTHRFNLKEGLYMFMPSTFEPNEEAKFLFRLFTEKV